MGPQTYNPAPNMPSRPNNGYGAPQTANYYNPYYANPNFNQQVPIQPRPDYLAGRVVSSEKDIRPNEVPMDGSTAIFPQADRSCIHVKWWGNNGLIEGVTYVLQQSENQQTAQSPFDEILTRLDKIEKSLARNNQKSFYNKPRSNNSTPVNKEGESNV